MEVLLRERAVVTPRLIKCVLYLTKMNVVKSESHLWVDSVQKLLDESKDAINENGENLGLHSLHYTTSDPVRLVRLETIEIDSLVYLFKKAEKHEITRDSLAQMAKKCKITIKTLPPTSLPTAAPSSLGYNEDEDDDRIGSD